MENTTAPFAENDTLTDRIVEKTPWWFLSAFGHAVLFALSALFIVMAQPKAPDEVLVVAPPKAPPPEPEIEKPKNFNTDKTFPVDKAAHDPIFKEAVEDPTEFETTIEHATPRGVSDDFVSNKPLDGLSVNDSAGVAGGAGGRFGRPDGDGRHEAAKKGGGGEVTEQALMDSLSWLARHQNEDGSWSMTAYLGRCGRVARLAGDCTPHGVDPAVDKPERTMDIGLTGLSLLAFLGAGYTHKSRDTVDGIPYGGVVRDAIGCLMRHQGRDGCIGSPDVHGFMYNHLIATLALSEAYGLTGSNKFKASAQAAVDFALSAQNPGHGWRYITRAGESDTSVTGWAVMALKSADLSGLEFDRVTAYDGARAWLDSMSYKVGGGTGQSTRWKCGYQANSPKEAVASLLNEHFDQHPSMTAISVMCRIFMDKKRNDPKVTGGAPVLLDDLPSWDGPAIDFYYWYYASMALFQVDGPDGPAWRRWNRAMVSALVDHQNRDGDKAGSWEPVGRWCYQGGRVYATAINALTLEVYYRYPSAFGAK